VPPSRLSTLMGQGGVAMFFMVTAMLFWNRALVSRGTMDLRRFFWSRIMRTVPMYFVASLAVIVTALALTHFELQVSISELLKSCAAWLLFTIPGTPDVNGLSGTWLINGVFWTLVYEWKFYLIFPILLLLGRGMLSVAVLVMCALLTHWYSTNNVEWYFIYGAFTAIALHRLPCVGRKLTGMGGSIAIFGLLACIYAVSKTVYDPRVAPLLFLVFLIIASGNSLFGLLMSRAARTLGAISYSLYLMHSFVLYLLFRAVNHFTPVASLPIPAYMGFVLLTVSIAVGLSAITYRYIEHPFLSRRLPP
jgi:peptidoglycan/LPS O-acetylase OafA/YrhL